MRSQIELGVEVNQDDIDTYAEQLVSQNGYESVEAMYNIYGFGDTDYGKRYFAGSLPLRPGAGSAA